MGRAMQYGVPYFVIATMLGLSSLLSACVPSDPSQDEATADDEDDDDEVIDYGAVADTPPIHLQQTVVMRLNGAAIIEANYRQHAEICDKLGDVGSRVSGQDVGKLGRTFYEVWYQGLRVAVRLDRWNYEYIKKDTPGCDFRVVHVSELHTWTPDGSWDVDLATGVGSFYPDSVMDRFPIDPEPEPEGMPQLSKVGDKVGDERFVTLEVVGYGSAMGQPCLIVNENNIQFAGVVAPVISNCMWTGGTQWGFSGSGPDGESDGGGEYTHGISLWQRADSNVGGAEELTTELFTVGAPFDQGVFNVPPGIKRVPAYGSEDDADTDPEPDEQADEAE